MLEKKKVLLLIISILVLAIGMSYAYFEAVVHGTGNTDAEGSAHTATIQDLILTGTTEVVNNNMIPGESSTYSFTIENPNTIPVCFGIYFDNVVNTFVNTSDLEVSMNDVVGLFPSTGDTSTIIGGFRAPANSTTTYTITITYKDVEGKDQTGDIGAIFSGTIKARTTECTPTESEKTLARLNLVVSNSDKCLHVDQNGMITDFDTNTLTDSDTPIVCAMEDDYEISYYLRGLHTTNNVKFANMCWKIIRITGTGGIKLIYNGDVDGSGTCTITSGNHNGFTEKVLNLSGNKLYGTGYTKSGDTYTLTDTSTMNWDTSQDNIKGKYTCGDTNSSCTELYAVIGKNTENTDEYAYAIKLDQSTNYAQVGTSYFNNFNPSSNNTDSGSPSLVGYMYNDTYPVKAKSLVDNSNRYYYGESFTYNPNNPRPYTLIDTVRFSDITNSTNKTSLNTHRYTCFYTTDDTCEELYFLYYLFDGKSLRYIKLEGNETVSNALDKMLRNDNINVNDSQIKGVIDWWYENNILGTTNESKLEDTVFCNDRTISDLGGWSETGEISTHRPLRFNASNNQYDNTFNSKYYLKCPSKRDAFTVSDTTNGNGSLDYPIGLLTSTEGYLVGNANARKTGTSYWSSTPYSFSDTYPYEGAVSGSMAYADVVTNVFYSRGVRPVISLKPGTTFESGTDGTPSNPFVVE